MASKLPRVVPTCQEGGFGPWFELDWTGRSNHSMAARHVVLAERKLTTYVYAVKIENGTLSGIFVKKKWRCLEEFQPATRECGAGMRATQGACLRRLSPGSPTLGKSSGVGIPPRRMPVPSLAKKAS
ncbi:hypothetical protein TIFTF001_030499 [Ficus carica]|uniref:Uncharacterized protein n=1 Tax=Ficus carica TaxID=3494 RepID=A0AA88DTY5_FICCA|nr:hypothetical protein TIFTF001_030499 [Ficus carica]